MITKQTAATLFAHSFRLVDKEGRVLDIMEIANVGMLLGINHVSEEYCMYNQIGTDFWVLKRDFSMLTKSITVEGEEITPYIELENEFRLEGYLVDLEIDIWKGYAMFSNESIGQYHGVPKEFFDKLHSMHFINLPEGTYKLIEESPA